MLYLVLMLPCETIEPTHLGKEDTSMLLVTSIVLTIESFNKESKETSIIPVSEIESLRRSMLFLFNPS